MTSYLIGLCLIFLSVSGLILYRMVWKIKEDMKFESNWMIEMEWELRDDIKDLQSQIKQLKVKKEK